VESSRFKSWGAHLKGKIMGDMADMITEDWGYDEYHDDEGKTCKYCGENWLWWVKTDKGWRLRNQDGIHSCRGKEVKENK
jgi:hypothetical protein